MAARKRQSAHRRGLARDQRGKAERAVRRVAVRHLASEESATRARSRRLRENLRRLAPLAAARLGRLPHAAVVLANYGATTAIQRAAAVVAKAEHAASPPLAWPGHHTRRQGDHGRRDREADQSDSHEDE